MQMRGRHHDALSRAVFATAIAVVGISAGHVARATPRDTSVHAVQARRVRIPGRESDGIIHLMPSLQLAHPAGGWLQSTISVSFPYHAGSSLEASRIETSRVAMSTTPMALLSW